MRYAIPTLFLILALLVLQSWFSNILQASPQKEAIAFLTDIQSGNSSKIVRHFGTNVCHCPKKKGWGAYLAYQTDEEPNLAFLLGHPFDLGPTDTKVIISPPQASHGVPWEQPEDRLVKVPIIFNKNSYRPVFLPLPLAYGKTMPWQEFEDFIKNPAFEYWKSYTLRLRSGLDENAIKFNTTTIEGDVRGEFKFALLPSQNKETSWYLTPKKPGQVIMPDGKPLAQDKMLTLLPRLSAITIELKVVRLGKLQPWTIAEFEFIDSVLETNDGQTLIKLNKVDR